MAGDKYNEIEAFAEIAQSKSFSAAARTLKITPSAVSKLVARLEARYGVRLFNRSTHKLRLSSDGELLLRRAQSVVSAMQHAEELADRFAAKPSGRLRVYCLPSFGLSRLGPVLPEFLEEFPDINIDLQMGTESIDPIESDIDVIIRWGHMQDSTLMSRKIGESSWVICGSPTYIEKHGMPEVSADLLDHNCLNFSLKTHEIAWVAKTPQNEERQVGGNASTNLAEMQRKLAISGVGLIRVSDFIVAQDIAEGRLIKVAANDDTVAPRPLFALFQASPSPRVRAFVDFLHGKFAKSPWND